MIRMHPSYSSAHCKDYFTSALQPGEYWINKQEAQGFCYGKIAERLGMVGPTDRDSFFALCDNKNPFTGENLTPRNKQHRTVAYDISYQAPKSVSIISALCGDDHIISAFQESVRTTMLEMQDDMLTRVRKKGKDEDRHTGEMIVSEFMHFTARPVDGSMSDPHLHIHNLVHNITFDNESSENRFKAGQFREINRSLPFYQQKFHKRFADKLMALGYKLRKTRSAFEIEGVPDHIIELMSKRTSQISDFAKEHGITDAKALDQLGAKTRNKKNKDWSIAELKAEWQKQIREATVDNEGFSDTVLRHKEKITSPELSPQTCVDHAAKHSFERLSTISDRRLLESAYRYSVTNNSVSLDDIDKAFKRDQRFLFVKDGYQNICTTKEVLAEEREMVMLARNGQGRFRPLYSELPKIDLDGQQKRAVEHILTSPNMVSIVRGVAGAGKTTALAELDRHIKAAGKEAFYFAPTGQAARDNLAKEGFTNAQTVARQIIDKNLQDNLQGQFIVIDEAGMIGTKDMRNLLKIATEKQARLVLVGDELQHHSIARGDAMKVLRTIGKIRPAEINKIRRQRNEKYRAAVQDLSAGNVNAAFGKLDEIEAIRQVDPLNPNIELVADYVATVKKGKSALIVSPTHKQGNSVTVDVRCELQKAGLLGKKEVAVLKLKSLNLTEAQKADWRNFSTDQVVQFNLPAPQITRGSVWAVEDISKNNVTIRDKKGQMKNLPLDKAIAFDVFEQSKINLAKGDRLRITKGGFDKDKKRLDNGQMFEVAAINRSGEIRLRNRDSKSCYLLKPDFGHIDHAYCTTSHGAQGQTCSHVFISQPASVFAATDSRQIYVSVSRGRDMVTIYTDDKALLLEYAERTGDRQSALELLAKTNNRYDFSRQPEYNRAYIKDNAPVKEKSTSRTIKSLDYEP